MLPKANRLKKENDFRRVARRGKLIKGGLMDLKFAANDLGLCRFGFVVSLRISKKATERNKVKRRLSEAACLFIRQIKNGYDFIILAKPDIIKSGFNSVKDDLGKNIKKDNLIA